MYSKLNNYYWQIRYTRIKAVRRKYYRYIAKEEKRLIDSGVDAEELRLLCRHRGLKSNGTETYAKAPYFQISEMNKPKSD